MLLRLSLLLSSLLLSSLHLFVNVTPQLRMRRCSIQVRVIPAGAASILGVVDFRNGTYEAQLQLTSLGALAVVALVRGEAITTGDVHVDVLSPLCDAATAELNAAKTSCLCRAGFGLAAASNQTSARCSPCPEGALLSTLSAGARVGQPRLHSVSELRRHLRARCFNRHVHEVWCQSVQSSRRHGVHWVSRPRRVVCKRHSRNGERMVA